MEIVILESWLLPKHLIIIIIIYYIIIKRRKKILLINNKISLSPSGIVKWILIKIQSLKLFS